MYADYNLLTHENINYSVDMLRLRTDITYLEFTKLEFLLNIAYKSIIRENYISGSISSFKYNYEIELAEGKSYWFGFIHNSELINKNTGMQNENTIYNFTIEFNPNKIAISGLLKHILSISKNWTIKSLDMAMDIKINILDLCRS